MYTCMHMCMYVTTCSDVAHFSDTLEHLRQEAGFDLENPKAAKFRSCVMAGNWREVMMSLCVR